MWRDKQIDDNFLQYRYLHRNSNFVRVKKEKEKGGKKKNIPIFVKFFIKLTTSNVKSCHSYHLIPLSPITLLLHLLLDFHCRILNNTPHTLVRFFIRFPTFSSFWNQSHLNCHFSAASNIWPPRIAWTTAPLHTWRTRCQTGLHPSEPRGQTASIGTAPLGRREARCLWLPADEK